MTPFAATRAPTPTLPTLPSTAPPPPRPAPAGAPGRSSAKGGRRWRGGRLLDRLARELGPLPAARRRPADIASSRVPFGPLRQRLVRSQERELRQPLDPRVRGAALDRLVLANLRLVASVARGYRGRGVEWDDLLQDGALGLMLAADLYRPERGEFRPFALLVIAHHLARAVADYVPLVSTPVPWAQAVARFRAYRWRFVQGHGRVPDDRGVGALAVVAGRMARAAAGCRRVVPAPAGGAAGDVPAEPRPAAGRCGPRATGRCGGGAGVVAEPQMGRRGTPPVRPGRPAAGDAGADRTGSADDARGGAADRSPSTRRTAASHTGETATTLSPVTS